MNDRRWWCIYCPEAVPLGLTDVMSADVCASILLKMEAMTSDGRLAFHSQTKDGTFQSESVPPSVMSPHDTPRLLWHLAWEGEAHHSFQMMTFVVARCCLSWRDRCKGQPTVPSLVSTSSSPLCHLCFFSQPSPPVLCRLLSFLRAFPSLSRLPVSFLLLVPVLPHPWLSAAPICG